MKIGVFGGTFNPVHFGHLRAAEEVREKLQLEKILFVPAKNPPLKIKDLAEAGHRYEMLRISIEDNKWFEISDVEFSYKGKSYTVKTIEILRREYVNETMYLIVGIDSFLDLQNWWRPDRLTDIVDFIVMARPGFSFIELARSPFIKTDYRILKSMDRDKGDMCEIKMLSKRKAILLKVTELDISSTLIRDYIKIGKSIKYLLPQEVYSYIIKNKLYKK
jgi:nicotinate-nucleotide adenylyltransferase